MTRVRRAVGSPIPHTEKHAFLESLHDLLRPAQYLEIGVQFGNSLWLTRPETVAVGVDPEPRCVPPPNATLVSLNSGAYFGLNAMLTAREPVDLAFIDGSHLVEDALRDFINVERLFARPDGRTVAVFDDVLPYSAAIAGRTPLPGDWAGDCWKIWGILYGRRPDLTCILVDVAPTGALVVLSLDPASTALAEEYDFLAEHWAVESDPGMDAYKLERMRGLAIRPDVALNLIRSHLESLA